MKAKLAAQTFSSSVADVLQFLNSDLKLKAFENCEATVRFIRVVDRLFDFLNSRHSRMTGYKSPIHLNNLKLIKDQVIRDCNYLLKLKSSDGFLLATTDAERSSLDL